MSNEEISKVAAAMGRRGGSVQSAAQKAQQEQRRQKALQARRDPAKLVGCSCDADKRPGEMKGVHRSRCAVAKRQKRAQQKADNQSIDA